MPSKAIATPANQSAAPAVKSSRGSGSSVPGMTSAQFSPFTQLQQSFGNQVMQQLLESGAIQAKMRISQPGDADEVEADRVAERVVRTAQAPKIQRKCSCSGQTRCATCEEEESKGIHRKTASSTDIHRSAASDQPDDAAPQSSQKHRGLSRPEHLIVEDGAEKLEHGQMRKSEFLKLMRSAVCATSDAALAALKLTTRGCPYIEKWLAFYSEQEASHIETALTKYAPEAARARTAREYISILNVRVERAVISWGKTGKLSGVPDELANQILGGGAGGGFLGKVMGFASSGFGKSILGFLGGGSKESSRTFFEKDLGSSKKDAGKGNRVQRKESASSSSGAGAAAASSSSNAARPADASAVKSKLGSGYALDSHLRSRMSSAFAYDFSKVRVHTDSQAAALSTSLSAKAFTVGEHVAFGSGEYSPGTVAGDLLIAHELAHVVQQDGGQTSVPLAKGTDSNGPLEQEADVASVHAVASFLSGASSVFGQLRQYAMPRLRSGLRIQRCSHNEKAKAPTTPAVTAPVANADAEPAAPALAAPVTIKFTDLPNAKRVADPTKRNHHIEIEKQGDDLFYYLPNGEKRRVPRPIDPDKKPPAPATIGKITWAADAPLQLAFSLDYAPSTQSGISLDLPTFRVNVFGRATAGDLVSSLLQNDAAQISPEGLEYEWNIGSLRAVPKPKRFEDAKRYHIPDAPFSLYVLANSSAEVATDDTGKTLGGPWNKIADLKVSPTGDVTLIQSAKAGETTLTFSLKGPKFVSGKAAASKDPKPRTDLIGELSRLNVRVIEKNSRFTVVELQAALDLLNAWKGKKSLKDAFKAAGFKELKLIKDLTDQVARFNDSTNEVHINGTMEIPEQEQRNMVVHELTHALFFARGLSVRGSKVPQDIHDEAENLLTLSETGQIQEGVIRGPRTASSVKKPRTQEEWEHALSTDSELNTIWRELHFRFKINDPEGTGDIRGFDAADESRHSGSVRGDVVGHGFDNVSEFMSSFVTSSVAYQSQLSETILRSRSAKLASLYQRLWTWVNTNLVSLGSQNPYDAVLQQVQGTSAKAGTKAPGAGSGGEKRK